MSHSGCALMRHFQLWVYHISMSTHYHASSCPGVLCCTLSRCISDEACLSCCTVVQVFCALHFPGVYVTNYVCHVILLSRCVLLCEPLRMDARSSESWNIVLGRFRHLLLASYSRCIDQYEEHIRAERERRTDASWSFCKYFMLQVLLTTVSCALVFSQLLLVS